MDEPYDRLARTAETMSTIGFGSPRTPTARPRTCARCTRSVQGQDQGAGRAAPGRHPLPRRPARPAAVGAVHARRLGRRGLPQVRAARCPAREEAAYWEDYKVSASCSASRVPTCPTRSTTSTTTGARCSRATRCSSPTGRASARARSCSSRRFPGSRGRCWRRPTSSPSPCCRTASGAEYGFAPLPPARVRKPLVAGGAEYVKRAVIPFLPDRLRLVPAARAA